MTFYRAEEDSSGLPLSQPGVRTYRSGYEWRDATDAEGDRIRVLEPIDRSAGSKLVDMDDPALCRTFSSLDGTEEGILEFANKYGDLCKGADFNMWARDIMEMSLVLDVAEARCGEYPEDDLEQWMYSMEPGWTTIVVDDPRFFDSPQPLVDIRGELEDREPARSYRMFDVADVLISMLINKRVEEYTKVSVLTPKHFINDRGGLSLEVIPMTLRGKLWLRAAQAVCGEHEFRQCGMCGKWFAVSTDARRSHSIYCQDACKSKHYRVRKREAKALHKEGMAPSAIAKELASDTNTVRGWLGMPPVKR